MINVQEYYDYLEDHRFAIEEQVNRLEIAPDNNEHITAILGLFEQFRLKASEHEVAEAEQLCSALHAIFTALTNGNFPFVNLLSDVVLLSIDHLFDLTKNSIDKTPNFDEAQIPLIKNSLRALAKADFNNIEELVENSLKALTSQLLIDEKTQDIKSLATENPGSSKNLVDYTQKLADHTIKTEQDLILFRSLIAELEYRFPTLNKRGERILPLALIMNEQAGNPVNPLQLEAAIYLHDVAMAFIPDKILYKKESLDQREREIIQRHPIVMAELLLRLGNWDEAAEIVRQHHEKIDGNGYPNKLTGTKICDGAKILAILDAFDAMTHVRSDRPFKKTILRAVTEITKNTAQFDNEWSKLFIITIKSYYTEQLVSTKKQL